MHEPEWSYSSNIQNDTFPGGNCLNIWAFPNISFFFGFVVLTLFIHPCLKAQASTSCCLNLFLTTLIPQHKRMKESLNEKHRLFILGMSQLPEQLYWTHSAFFFSWAFRGMSSGLNRRMYRFWHVYFHGKGILDFQQDQHIFVVVAHVSAGALPITTLGGFFKQCFVRRRPSQSVVQLLNWYLFQCCAAQTAGVLCFHFTLARDNLELAHASVSHHTSSLICSKCALEIQYCCMLISTSREIYKGV